MNHDPIIIGMFFTLFGGLLATVACLAAFGPRSGITLYPRYSQGAGGRHRWSLFDALGRFRAAGPVYGFDSEAGARADADEIRRSRW